MTRRVHVAAVAGVAGLAGLVAVVGAVAHSEPDHPRSAGSAESAGSAGSAEPDVEPDPTCQAELAELDRRDAAGEIDWEAIEGDDEEPTDEELASVVITAEPYPGDVATGGERPTFPYFPDRLDVEALSDEDLATAVDTCYEVGLLADEATDD